MKTTNTPKGGNPRGLSFEQFLACGDMFLKAKELGLTDNQLLQGAHSIAANWKSGKGIITPSGDTGLTALTASSGADTPAKRTAGRPKKTPNGVHTGI